MFLIHTKDYNGFSLTNKKILPANVGSIEIEFKRLRF